MTIKDEVLQVITKSPKAVFAEDITHLMPNVKIGTVSGACSQLLADGLVKAKHKNRQDSRIAAVFYVRDEQIKGMEGLMPYERVPRAASKKPRASGPRPGDILIALPLGKNKTELFTLQQARGLYEELKAVFEPKGKGA